MTTTTGTTTTTTNRSDFTWPRVALKQRTYDWDRYEFKARHPERTPPQPPQWFRCSETLEPMLYSRRLRFDFGFHPKPILGSRLRPPHIDDENDYGSRCPSKIAVEYDRDRAAERIAARSSRPRVFMCPQISLDDVRPADRRDSLCAYVYATSKTMSELTSGVPPPPSPLNRPVVHVDAPSKPKFLDCGPGKTQPLSSYMTIKPPQNWRHVSIEWDQSQKRIFGGRSTD